MFVSKENAAEYKADVARYTVPRRKNRGVTPVALQKPVETAASDQPETDASQTEAKDQANQSTNGS